MKEINQHLWYRALIMAEYVSFLETAEERNRYATCLYNAMIWGLNVNKKHDKQERNTGIVQ